MIFDHKYSMSFQDEFAFRLFGSNGTYIEIGGNEPIRHSNTYNLEVYKRWKGFSIELDTVYKPLWEGCSERKNKIYWADALDFDYKDAVKKLKLPSKINYLSVDIEPASNTFKALETVITQGIEFDIITFEHDIYREIENFDLKAREFLDSKNYKVAVENIYFKKKSKSKPKIYETWFINKNFKWKSIDYKDWLTMVDLPI